MHWLLMILRWLVERPRLGTPIVQALRSRVPFLSLRGGMRCDYRSWAIPNVGKMKVCRVLKFFGAPPGWCMSGALLTAHREEGGRPRVVASNRRLYGRSNARYTGLDLPKRSFSSWE